MPTPSEIQSEILAEIGDVGRNAIYQVLLPLNTSAGTWTLTVSGQTTAALAYNATRGAIQAEVEALSTVEAGNMQVRGERSGPRQFEPIGELAGQAVTITANGAGLTPAAVLSVTEEQEPQLPRYASVIAAIWSKYAGETLTELRKQKVKLELLERELGRLREQVDKDDGVESIKASQMYRQTATDLARTQAKIAALEAQQSSAAAFAPRYGETAAHANGRSNYKNRTLGETW